MFIGPQVKAKDEINSVTIMSPSFPQPTQEVQHEHVTEIAWKTLIAT